MTVLDTIRTERIEKKRRERVAARPEFKVGDDVEVYSGLDEGHCFTIKAVRYNHDIACIEYYRDSSLFNGWYPERALVKA